jgi:hypothetical protein
LIKELEIDLGTSTHILKRLNVAKSTKTKRKLGLFGWANQKPDFEWSAIDKVSDIAANKLLKLCGFEWKEYD